MRVRGTGVGGEGEGEGLRVRVRVKVRAKVRVRVMVRIRAGASLYRHADAVASFCLTLVASHGLCALMMLNGRWVPKASSLGTGRVPHWLAFTMKRSYPGSTSTTTYPCARATASMAVADEPM